MGHIIDRSNRKWRKQLKKNIKIPKLKHHTDISWILPEQKHECLYLFEFVVPIFTMLTNQFSHLRHSVAQVS